MSEVVEQRVVVTWKSSMAAGAAGDFLDTFPFVLLPHPRSNPPTMLANAWTFSTEDALGYYGTNAESGLTEEQVKRNKELYGENGQSFARDDRHR